MLPIFWRSV